MDNATTIHALTGPGGKPLPALFTGPAAIEAAWRWAAELYEARGLLAERGKKAREEQRRRGWRRMRFGDEEEEAAP